MRGKNVNMVMIYAKMIQCVHGQASTLAARANSCSTCDFGRFSTSQKKLRVQTTIFSKRTHRCMHRRTASFDMHLQSICVALPPVSVRGNGQRVCSLVPDLSVLVCQHLACMHSHLNPRACDVDNSSFTPCKWLLGAFELC